MESPAIASANGTQLIVVAADQHRTRHEMQRLALLIGSGLLGGLALATLGPRHWSRVGAALFGGGAWVLRSPVGPALLAALVARLTAPGVEVPRPAE